MSNICAENPRASEGIENSSEALRAIVLGVSGAVSSRERSRARSRGRARSCRAHDLAWTRGTRGAWAAAGVARGGVWWGARWWAGLRGFGIRRRSQGLRLGTRTWGSLEDKMKQR